MTRKIYKNNKFVIENRRNSKFPLKLQIALKRFDAATTRKEISSSSSQKNLLIFMSHILIKNHLQRFIDLCPITLGSIPSDKFFNVLREEYKKTSSI